jgi:hypothetical protein
MSDILDLIDGAIGAHELSADAMRWSPEPVDEYRIVAYGVDGSTVVAVTHDGHYTIIDEVHEWGSMEPIRRFDAVMALSPTLEPDPELYPLVDLPELRRWYR